MPVHPSTAGGSGLQQLRVDPQIAMMKYFGMIAIWGSTRKEYGAMKLVLYSFVGSSMVFIGMLGMFFIAGAKTTGAVTAR